MQFRNLPYAPQVSSEIKKKREKEKKGESESQINNAKYEKRPNQII